MELTAELQIGTQRCFGLMVLHTYLGSLHLCFGLQQPLRNGRRGRSFPIQVHPLRTQCLNTKQESISETVCARTLLFAIVVAIALMCECACLHMELCALWCK